MQTIILKIVDNQTAYEQADFLLLLYRNCTFKTSIASSGFGLAIRSNLWNVNVRGT